MDNKQLKSRLNGKLAQAGQAEAGNGIAEAKTEITALQKSAAPTLVASNGYIALNSNAIEIIGENLKNQPLSFQLFDIVKSPSGGATVFAVPGLSGEEAEKELTGVILDYTTPRAYWDTPDPVEGMAPVCFSHDSQTSTEGKACPRCEFNTFGSKNGESQAKACKESVLLFLLRPDSIIPLIVRVPVSSKVLFQKYTTRLCSALTPIS
ncbi:MAG: hypothetical protein LBI54_05095, partial [Lachnospiraceae bacterium]|nr:hypothetical protein [Lachnospiraceae bacterium]